ncbi:MAG TPA: autotransporter assembly complex family protein [Steroidobacteraceae bacterium]|nr:autotransporter assembly complex family protein [Steroidobacteraceae bacterium]
MKMWASQRVRSAPLLALALLGWSAAQASNLEITIDGLKDELEHAARANLTLEQYRDRDASEAQIRRLFAGAEREISAALEPYGYYNSQVTSELRTTEKGFDAVFHVTLGPPTLVVEQNVVVSGDAANLPPVKQAVRRFEPRKGQRLDHGEYEASKEAVETALQSVGYLRMQATTHRVEVTRRTHTARIDVEWESGPRLRFGPVHFSKSQFPPGFLDRFIPWKEGDYFSQDQVLALQQRLANADYFATISTLPDLSNKDSLDVPIRVEVTPAKPTIYTASVYITTDTGFGVQIGKEKRWINSAGHKAGVDIDWAQRRQIASAHYLIPLPGPHDRSFNFGISYKNEDTNTSHSRNTRVSANELRQWHGYTRTLGFVSLAGTFEIAEEQNYSKLFYAEGSLTRKKADDLSFPRNGYSLAYVLRAGPEKLLSDTSFVQVFADGKYIRPLGSRQRLILRGTLGTLTASDFDELPPELRFFAGGDRSIRGFDYQQIGSTNSAGEVIGGTHLAVASVEVERYFVPKWGMALFVDGGDAFRTERFRWNVGAGLGVRWRSPIGVVRVDVAKPVVSDLADKIRYHIAIGPDL